MKSRVLIPTDRLLDVLGLTWGLPTLAAIWRGEHGVAGRRGGGVRFVPLMQRLGAPRDSLRRTLEALIEQGLVARYPFHSHPLRPEFIFTPAGLALAERCAAVLDALDRAGADATALRKWSLPAACALRHGALGFNAIKEALPGVTSRALAMTLKDLEASGLVVRTIVAGYPPRPSYALSATARPLASAVEALLAAA
jgi:DNA-binding HxlR family transcriptional regulator